MIKSLVTKSRLDLCLLFITVLVLFVTANEQSLWLDELATVAMSFPSGGFAYDDAQMPLTYAAVFFFMKLMGSTSMAFRMPILLSSLLLIMMIPRFLIKKGSPLFLAYGAPLLLLFHPSYIYYSQEVRAYLPMVSLLIIWGYYRNIGGWRSFLLCTLALQANTFSFLFVGSVTLVDFVLGTFIKPKVKVPKATWYALLFHLISFGYMFYKIKASRFTGLTDGNENLTHLFDLERFWRFANLGYLKSSFNKTFFYWNNTRWTVIGTLSLLAILFTRHRLNRFWMGLLIGLFLQAFLIRYVGWPNHERYLIMMLPLVCLPVFQFSIKNAKLQIAMVISLFFMAHYSPGPKAYDDHFNGLLAKTFFQTAKAFKDPVRDNWKSIIKTIDKLGKPGDKIWLRCGGQCATLPFDFYGIRTEKIASMKISSGCENTKWIIAPIDSRDVPEVSCSKPLFAEFGTLRIYADPKEIFGTPVEALPMQYCN